MPELTIRQQKQVLRKRMRVLRDAITPEQRRAWSARICARVLASSAYQQARVIHCYLPIRSEVDPRSIVEHAFAHGKRVAIPLWQAHTDETHVCEIDTLSDDAFEVDAMGLRIPRRRVLLPPGEIDLVLVPLLAFAPSPGTPEEGYVRLGYGAGFYDRFLRRTQARRVGLAFALQQVDTLPQAETDTLLDDVITE
jgi:5-formyltetrahydrofolate cyclo-ligase